MTLGGCQIQIELGDGYILSSDRTGFVVHKYIYRVIEGQRRRTVVSSFTLSLEEGLQQLIDREHPEEQIENLQELLEAVRRVEQYLRETFEPEPERPTVQDMLGTDVPVMKRSRK
jgi:hypothetical protein